MWSVSLVVSRYNKYTFSRAWQNRFIYYFRYIKINFSGLEPVSAFLTILEERYYIFQTSTPISDIVSLARGEYKQMFFEKKNTFVSATKTYNWPAEDFNEGSNARLANKSKSGSRYYKTELFVKKLREIWWLRIDLCFLFINKLDQIKFVYVVLILWLMHDKI